ncbi:TIGR02679 family protein [Allorhizocola rhizosphaerae]|uniref:TIGR02679 family protein n=1 Tax=Allorhizocola rhizosphaerae TaxID=1872709 RepID=UPI000E3CC667|nr:TIGR02679 family protein [Allorhizocola rhizosphaerae]
MTDPAHDPTWTRLLANARRSLERNGGSLETTISLTAPTEDERLLIIGVTGVHRTAGANRLAVRLAELDAYLRQAHGRSLLEVLGPSLRNRPAERQAEADARRAALALAMSCKHHGAEWFHQWLEEIQRDGTIARLVRAGRDLAPALRVLDALPAEEQPMPAFAERLLGNTKALTDSALRGLLIKAIALWQGVDPPANGEAERALWELVGVVRDDLASQVLVLNLPGDGGFVGDWLTQAAQIGVPFRLTLNQLRMCPIVIQAEHVYVTENPAILRAACTLGPSAPAMICTEGVPSAAAHRLLGQATSATLWWRNDFDWAGVRMTAAALARYPNARPWRMSAQDYRSAAGSGQPLLGTPAATPWDAQLAIDMLAIGQSVMEERLLPTLIADLRKGRSPGS